MNDSRSRFEAWAKAPPFEFDLDRFNGIVAWPGAYRNYSTHCAWDAWQAAEAETARRCAELVEGQGAIGGHRSVMADAIRAEFPEVFK